MIKGKEKNIKKMLGYVGISQFLADMAVPYMYMRTGTVDPESPSVILIIRGLQQGLRRLDFPVEVNGVFDDATRQAVDVISSPADSWVQKTWLQIYGDLIYLLKNPGERERVIAHEAMGAYDGELPASCVAVDGFLGSMGLGSTITDSGVPLTWGLGVSSSSNCVPSDASTKAVFRNLQRQVNRIGAASQISEDGIIGNKTISAVHSTEEHVRGQSLVKRNCAAVSASAQTLATMFKQYADSLGISAAANPGPVDTVVSRTETAGPSLSREEAIAQALVPVSIFSMDTVKQYAPYALLAAGAAWFFAEQDKKKKGKRA